MDGLPRIVLGLVLGILFPAAVVGIAALAPYANEWFMTPVDGRLLGVAWWFMVPLGVAAAVGVARRMWPGVVAGIASVIGFNWSLTLLLPAGEQAAAASTASSWIIAVLSVGLPWAVGMAFGWTSLHQHAVRNDGVPHDGPTMGRIPR